jgi:hypothetical protein
LRKEPGETKKYQGKKAKDKGKWVIEARRDVKHRRNNKEKGKHLLFLIQCDMLACWSERQHPGVQGPARPHLVLVLVIYTAGLASSYQAVPDVAPV